MMATAEIALSSSIYVSAEVASGCREEANNTEATASIASIGPADQFSQFWRRRAVDQWQAHIVPNCSDTAESRRPRCLRRAWREAMRRLQNRRTQ